MLSRINNTTAIVRKSKSAYFLTLFEGKAEICHRVPVDTENDSLQIALEFAIDEYRDKITADAGELSGMLLSASPIEIGEVLPQVDKVIDYGVPGGMDVFIGSDVFRLDGDSFTNPHPFELWYVATKHRPVNINPADYKLFVTILQSMAQKSLYDPIGMTIIDRLCQSLKGTPIYTDCGIDYYNSYNISPNDIHPYLDGRKWHLYINSSGLSSLAEIHKIPLKRMRDYISPYLFPPGQDQKWIGDRRVAGASANIRMWVFDFKKLAKYDSSLKPSKLTLVDSAGEIIEAKKWLVEVEK